MPGPTPERSLTARILQLEQKLRELLRRFSQREAQVVPRPQTRNGRVTEVLGVFPNAPANTFGVIFDDGDFVRTPGLQTPTLAAHSSAAQVIAHNLCGHYIRNGNRVMLVEIGRRWWIVRDFGPARWIKFSIDELYGFDTSDGTVNAAVSDYWQGSDPGAAVTLKNTCGIFSGDDGACGLACYDDVDDTYWIVQLICPTYPGGGGGGQNLNTWQGSPNLNTLGTITTGEWNADPIAVAYGGTGGASVAAAQSNLQLVPGTDVMGYSAELEAIAVTVEPFGIAFLASPTAGDARDAVELGATDLPRFAGLGIGTPAVADQITIVGGSGVFLAANNETDATNKSARWGLLHYLAAEEPFFCFIPSSSAANNIASFGGGSSLGNAATRIDLWTGAATTTTTGSRRGSVDNDGNLLWGTLTSPTANGGKAIVLGDNAANPTLGTNTAGLFAKDVAGTVELFAVDEAGTATQLSEHAGDAPAWLYDNDGFPERVSRVEDSIGGKIEWVNRSRLERLLELQFAGDPLPAGNARKIRHRESFAAYNARMGLAAGDPRSLVALDWPAVETARRARRAAAMAEWDAWDASRRAAIERGETFDDPEPYNGRPAEYQSKPPRGMRR